MTIVLTGGEADAAYILKVAYGLNVCGQREREKERGVGKDGSMVLGG